MAFKLFMHTHLHKQTQAYTETHIQTDVLVNSYTHAYIVRSCFVFPLRHQLRELSDPANVYDECMNFIVNLASCGLIHGDFNEFNIMVKDDETIVVYDLPQTVSTSHFNAEL